MSGNVWPPILCLVAIKIVSVYLRSFGNSFRACAFHEWFANRNSRSLALEHWDQGKWRKETQLAAPNSIIGALILAAQFWCLAVELLLDAAKHWSPLTFRRDIHLKHQ